MSARESRQHVLFLSQRLIHALGTELSTLNESKALCDCCKLSRFENYEEYKLAEELRALRSKLEKLYVVLAADIK